MLKYLVYKATNVEGGQKHKARGDSLPSPARVEEGNPDVKEAQAEGMEWATNDQMGTPREGKGMFVQRLAHERLPGQRRGSLQAPDIPKT